MCSLVASPCLGVMAVDLSQQEGTLANWDSLGALATLGFLRSTNLSTLSVKGFDVARSSL